MADIRIKEVRFDQWCPYCLHKDKAESEDPCWDCLKRGWNIDSRCPIFWEGDLNEAIESQKAQAQS